MNALLDPAGRWLHTVAELSWKGALLALAAGLLILLLRRRLSPAWRHGLWLLVLLRFAVPDLASSPWSMVRWNPLPKAIEVSSATDAEGPWMEPMPDIPAHALPPPRASAASLEPEGAIAAPAPVARSIPWTRWQWLTFVWLTGFAGVIGVMGTLHLRMWRRLQWDRAEPSPSAQTSLREACKLAHVRRTPTLVVTGAVQAPALFGILRPMILLPRNHALSQDPASLKLILLHELAHLQRRDLWAQVAASLIIALHWFNPIAWWAGRSLRAEAEMAADARVLREDAKEAHRMGEVLLSFANQAAAGWMAWFASATLLGISANKRDLRHRIEALLDLARGRRTWWLMGLTAFIVLAIAGLTRAPAEDAKKAAAAAGEIATTVTGIVVDEAGTPVKGAEVHLSINRHDNSRREEQDTGDDGRFTFSSVPKAADLNLRAKHPEFADSKPLVFKGYSENEERRLVLSRVVWVVGKVTGKRDGKPIKDAMVFFGLERNMKSFSRYQWKLPAARTSETGDYRLPIKVPDLKEIIIRAWAPEMTSHSELLKITNSEMTFNVALAPAERIAGKVINAEGQPVKDALVWVVEDSVRLDESGKPITVEFLKSKDRSKLAEGTLLLSLGYSKEGGDVRLRAIDPFLKDHLWIVALHPEEGFASMRGRDFKAGSVFKLERWASLSGKLVRQNGSAVSDATVSGYSRGDADSLRAAADSLKFSHHIKFKTDQNGEFKIDRLVPGSSMTGVYIDKNYHSIDTVTVSAGPQRSRVITLRASLTNPNAKPVRSVQGRIVLPEGFGFRSDDYFMYLSLTSNGVVVPGMRSPDEDGRFMTPPLPSGSYELSFHVSSRDSQMDVPRDASRWLQFKIEPDAVQTPLDVGEIRVAKADLTLTPRKATDPPVSKSAEYVEGPNGRITINTADADRKPVAGVKIEVLDFLDHTQAPMDLQGIAGPMAEVISDERGKAILMFPRTPVPGRRAFGVRARGVTADGFKSRETDLMDGRETELRVYPEASVEITISNPIVKWTAAGIAGVVAEHQPITGGMLKARLPLIPGNLFNAFMVQGTTADGGVLFSKAMVVPQDLQQSFKANLTLSPGVEIKGTIEDMPGGDAMPGWVVARVFVKAEMEPGLVSRGSSPTVGWAAWAPVARDGSFHFAGMPQGMLVVGGLGRGWITRDDRSRGADALVNIADAGAVVNVTLRTKPCFEKTVRLLLPDGTPASGATIKVRFFATPNTTAMLMPTRHAVELHDAAHYERVKKEGWPGLQATADAEGYATLGNVPEGKVHCQVFWIDPKTSHSQWDSITVEIDPKAESPVVIQLPAKNQ